MKTLEEFICNQDFTYYNERGLSVLDWWIEDGDVYILLSGNDDNSVSYKERLCTKPSNVFS